MSRRSVTLSEGQHYNLPDTALPIASANETVEVIVTREQIAEEEIKEETKQRVLGIMPNFYTSYVWDAAPMNTRQKFKLSLRASTDPWVFARTAITAGIQQANNTYPEYGDGGSGYAKRYFAAYGDALTGRIIGSAVLPSIFHQDPRYFYRGTGGVPRRVLHALVSAVAARTDGGHIEPNYTHILGDFTAGYLSKTWHPGSETGFTLAAGRHTDRDRRLCRPQPCTGVSVQEDLARNAAVCEGQAAGGEGIGSPSVECACSRQRFIELPSYSSAGRRPKRQRRRPSRRGC